MNSKALWIPFFIIFTLIGAVLGNKAGEWYTHWEPVKSSISYQMAVFVLFAATLVGGLVGLLIASTSFQRAVRVLSGMDAIEKIVAAVFLFLGVAIGAVIGYPFMRQGTFPASVTVAILVICGFFGVTYGLSMKDELSRMFGRSVTAEAQPSSNYYASGEAAANIIPPKIMDTNVIIDGRIADICMTGFIEGPLLIPTFVLGELQHIADSADSLRRARGRRGLTMLTRMQKELASQVEVWEEYPAEFDDGDPVDLKLVKLARHLNGAIVTNDFNLNKVADLHGVQVLNVNALANALKPVYLPGEHLQIDLVKLGKEARQGIGYLDDGTMVVVENGEEKVGSTVTTTVTSVLQTVAGKMIFAELADSKGYNDLRTPSRGRRR